jgi:hypothetical protein|nr:DUF6674 family protein [Agathobacter rectalis]
MMNLLINISAAKKREKANRPKGMGRCMKRICRLWRKKKMNNKLEVIGIDHGWSMMKTISQVFVTGVKSIVDKAKEKGRSALYRLSEFLGIKKRLLDIRENVRGAIKTTDKDIAKTELLAKGFREAGQTVTNAFRTFADKPEVDYSQKEQKQTEPERAEAERVEAEVVYAPMVAEPQEYQYNADAFEARGVDEVKQEAAHKEAPKVRDDKAR